MIQSTGLGEPQCVASETSRRWVSRACGMPGLGFRLLCSTSTLEVNSLTFLWCPSPPTHMLAPHSNSVSDIPLKEAWRVEVQYPAVFSLIGCWLTVGFPVWFCRQTKPLTFADCIGDELPVGWEEAYDPHVGAYYVDHNTSKLNKLQPTLCIHRSIGCLLCVFVGFRWMEWHIEFDVNENRLWGLKQMIQWASFLKHDENKFLCR